MRVVATIVFPLAVITLAASCNSGDNLCDQARIEIHDPQLYSGVVGLLEDDGINFAKGTENEICYRPSDHDLIRSYIIDVKSKTHPIGSRIDLARGMDAEVIESLREANVRFTWSVDGDRLVLIINPEDYERADHVIDDLFKKKFSGK